MPEALSIVPNEGLAVKVDGKPVEGSLADPAHQIEMASYAFYTLSVPFFWGVALAIITGDGEATTDIVVNLLIASLLVVLGINVKKMPRLSISIGSFIGSLALLGMMSMIGTEQQPGFFAWLFIGGSTLVLWQSLIFTFKKKHLS